jgi:type III secretion protein N (ATPase)
MLAKLEDIELLLQMGDYKPGEDALADKAIAFRERIDEFLRQDIHQPSEMATTLALLRAFAS